MNEKEEAMHTPGPWSVGWRITTFEDEPRPVTAVGGAAGEWVALLPHGWFDGFGVCVDGEIKANAALIAAAPDQNAALLQCVDRFERITAWLNEHGPLPGFPAFDAAEDQARAALSAAKKQD